MATNVKISTGCLNSLLGSQSIRDIFRACKIQIRTGAAALPDAAVAGTLLCEITRDSLDTKVAQVVTITPTVTETTANTWTIVVNGTTVIYTSDATTTKKEICDNFKTLLDIVAGGDVGAIVTPGTAVINGPKTDGTFTVSEDDNVITITSATTGVPIDVTSSCTGTGNTFITTTTVEDAYGISLEEFGSITSGVIEKASGETWSGVALVDGTPGHAIMMTLDDNGGSSTSLPRIVGICSTSNAPFIVRTMNMYAGATQTMDSFKITLPAS